MKLKRTVRLLLCVAIASTGSIHAQVTIGSTEAPRAGSLLDLTQGTSTTKGLNMPRVELSDLDPDTPAELSASIGGTGNWNMDEHTALVVYNTKADYCPTNPIYEGLYVFDGNEWQFQGLEGSPDVHSFTDARDGNEYLYREFYYMDGATKVSAGNWMLQNLRYVPDNTDDGFKDFIHMGTNAYTAKYWCYTWRLSGAYDNTRAEADWQPITGILYGWTALMNGRTPTGEEGQGGTNEADAEGVQGICPQDWHVPTDREWNELERAIYNNPTAFSQYTAADVFTPVTWQASWETTTGYRGATVTTNGHGLAMLAECPPPGLTETFGGKSLPAAQGGFDAIPVGNRGNTYGTYAYIWTGSANGTTNAWYRTLAPQAAQGTKVKMSRNSTSRGGQFSVRCVKDS